MTDPGDLPLNPGNRPRYPSFREIIDITMPLDADTPCYPGDTKFERIQVAHSTPGGGFNVSRLSMSAHSGTHVDAPNHFIHGGTTIDGIETSRWITRALVCECGGASSVEPGASSVGPDAVPLADLRPGCAVIFKLNSEADFNGDPSLARTLSPEAASTLIDAGVALVGIDWLSIEADDNPDYPVHRALLGAGIPIVENLRLRHVEEGWYTLVVAPLLVTGGDGAPARALLLR